MGSVRDHDRWRRMEELKSKDTSPIIIEINGYTIAGSNSLEEYATISGTGKLHMYHDTCENVPT